jgi:acyl-CoA synthetase (AMP-forming)/AMP-acid ligase II
VDCVVVVVEKPGEAPALHAAYSGEWIAPREIIADLRRTLPDYMVPRRFTRLDDVPRNANGKTDRRAVLRLLEG